MDVLILIAFIAPSVSVSSTHTWVWGSVLHASLPASDPKAEVQLVEDGGSSRTISGWLQLHHCLCRHQWLDDLARKHHHKPEPESALDRSWHQPVLHLVFQSGFRRQRDQREELAGTAYTHHHLAYHRREHSGHYGRFTGEEAAERNKLLLAVFGCGGHVGGHPSDAHLAHQHPIWWVATCMLLSLRSSYRSVCLSVKPVIIL